MQNQEKLRQNMTRMGTRVPARRAEARVWTYVCHGDRGKGQKGCWTVSGARIDEAVETLFLETMVPSEIELSLAVDHEVARPGQPRGGENTRTRVGERLILSDSLDGR